MKVQWIVGILVVFVILPGCNEAVLSPNPAAQSDTFFRMPMPARLVESRMINRDNLSAKILVNDVQRPWPSEGTEFSESFEFSSGDVVKLEVIWLETLPDSTEISLMSYEDSRTITSDTSIVVSPEDYTSDNFDDDSDGFTNFREREDGTDPTDPGSPPQPIDEVNAIIKINPTSASNSGWIVFSTGPQAGRYQWISEECRAQLAANGVAVKIIQDYQAEIGSLDEIDPWQNCESLLDIITTDTIDPEVSNTAVFKTNSTVATAGGWIVFSTGPEAGRQQWVPGECRAQLAANGVAEKIVQDYQAEIGSFDIISPSKHCDLLLDIITTDTIDPEVSNTAVFKTNSTVATAGGWIVFSTGPEAGRQQWVPGECRVQLAASGVAEKIIQDYEAEIGLLEIISPWKNCDLLLGLIN